MTNQYYRVEITLPLDAPEQILKEHLEQSLYKVILGDRSQIQVRVKKLVSDGESVSAPTGKVRLTKVPERSNAPMIDIIDPLIPVGEKVEYEHLSDDLQYVIDWAVDKMVDEKAEKVMAEKAYRPDGYYRPDIPAVPSISGSGTSVPAQPERKLFLKVHVPDELAARIGFRPLYGVSITDSKGNSHSIDLNKKETDTVADKHFQEPVTQPGRKHPFDGPEMFDDKTEPRRSIGEAYPRLQEFMAHKREEPKAEGDWQLEDGDRVGEDTV